MTDKLIVTDGTSSGLSAGAAISDTDAIEAQQTTTAPASTVYTTFAAIWTWILSKLSANASTVRANIGVQSKFKKYIAGRYYRLPGLAAGPSAAALSANRILLVPFIASDTFTISEFMVRLNTASAGGNWQAALYASDATTLLWTGLPIAKSGASGSTATGSTNVVTALAANYQLQEGLLYWIAFNVDNTTATFAQVLAGFNTAAELIGDATAANALSAGGSDLQGYYIAQTFGTWPDLTSVAAAGVMNSNIPNVFVKVASRP